MYSHTKGAEVMIIVSPEFEKVAKALAGGNVKSICRLGLFLPILDLDKRLCPKCPLWSTKSVPCCAKRKHSQCHCSAMLNYSPGMGSFMSSISRHPHYFT